MGELRKLRLGNAENVVTPYTAGDETIIIDETTRQIKVNPEEIATQDDLSEVKEDLSQKADIIISSAEGTVASFSDGAEYDAVSLIAHFEPYQEGTGDPSPDNVRPIHGWTGLTIGDTLRNLTPNCERDELIAVYIPANTYVFASGVYVGSGATRINLYRKDKSFIDYWSFIQTSISGRVGRYFRCAEDIFYVEFINVYDVQLEVGSEITEYENSGSRTPISWQTEAGEVFGGYADVTRGKLVATWYGFVLDGVNNRLTSNPNKDDTAGTAYVYDYFGAGGLSNIQPSIIPSYTSSNVGKYVKCDKFIAVGGYTTEGFNFGAGRAYFRLILKQSRLADVSSSNAIRDSINAWLSENPVKVAYRLSTPIEYDITPTAIKLLKGYNNVWNSAGGNNEVQYKADTKLYIDNLLGTTEDDMTANANIANGKFFSVGNRLFLSTAAIAQGATIVPGTNCTELTISDALNQVNA